MVAHEEHAAVLRRHAAYYEGLFSLSYDLWEDTADAVWLAQTRVELDNVRAALEWALETPAAADLAISLAGSAALLWDKAAPLAEGRRILERAEALIRPSTPPQLAARLYRQIGAVLALIGFVRTSLGASAAANEALHEARAILAPHGCRKSLFNVMNHLGVLAAIEGDMAAAREMFAQALQITQRTGNRDDEVVVLVNLAEVEFNLGQTGAAVERTGTAIALLRGTERKTDLGWALTNLATYLLISQRLPEATRAASEGLSLVRPAGGFILRVCLLQWALLAACGGRVADAARLAGFVEAGYRQAGEAFQPTEQRLYEYLEARLEAGLTPAELTTFAAEGGALTEAQAAALAARLAAEDREGNFCSVRPKPLQHP
jgi:non-specific serine/threonine protein kinase